MEGERERERVGKTIRERERGEAREEEATGKERGCRGEYDDIGN